MSKHATLMFAAAVLASALSSDSAAAETAILQRCGKPMADAEQMSKTIVECSSLLDSARAALAATAASTAGPEEKVVTSTSPLPADMMRAALAGPLHGALISHYAYSAFAAGDLAPCAPLSHLGPEQEALCRRVVADLVFVRARYRSNAEFVSACRQTDADSAPDAAGSACCGLLAETRAGSAPCAKLVPKCIDAATCRAYFASSAGDARACRSLPMPPEGDCKGDDCRRLHEESIANCEADAQYAKAFKAGGASACEGSRRCRVLMGEGKSVAREIAAKDLKNPVGAWFLKSGWTVPVVISRSRAPMKAPPAAGAAMKKLEFMGFACAEPLASKENRAAMAAVLGAARTCLSDVEVALARPARSITEAIDEREEMLIRLGLRLDKLFEGAKPAKARAPAAK